MPYSILAKDSREVRLGTQGNRVAEIQGRCLRSIPEIVGLDGHKRSNDPIGVSGGVAAAQDGSCVDQSASIGIAQHIVPFGNRLKRSLASHAT